MTMQDPTIGALPALDLGVGQVQRREPVDRDAEWWEVVNAGFEQENTFVSTLDRLWNGRDVAASRDPNYSAWSDIQGTPYEDHWSVFADSPNAAVTTMLKKEIDDETANRRMLESAGIGGFLAGLAGSIIDPTLLIPVGGELKLAGSGVWAVGRAAGRVGAAGATGTAIQETFLQGSQSTRSGAETALNIGSSAVLAGLIGGGFAGLLSRAESKSAEQALEALASPSPGSIGAAAVERATLDDLTMSSFAGFGGAAERIADTTKILSPNLQAQFSPSARVRGITQSLAENTLYQRMNDEGRSLGAAVETQARVTFEGRTATVAREMQAIFKEAKKGGVGMSRNDFENAVTRAMRRGDVGENDFVTRAAQSVRKNLIDPYKNEALDLGLLDDAAVQTTTAESYVPRQYNRERLVQEGGDFKRRIAGYYENTLSERFVEAEAALQKRLTNVERELSDLRMGPEDRIRTLDELRTEGERLDRESAPQREIVDRINDLRGQQRTARATGNSDAVRVLQKSIDTEKAAGGDALKVYQAQRRDLRSRYKRVDLNYAGLDERHEAILQSLADMEEANVRTLNRLVERGRKLEREIQRLDPDDARDRISQLRGDFMAVAEKADKAVDRARKGLDKLEADAAKKLEAGEAPDVVQAEKDAAQRARVEKEIAAQANRSDRMTRLAEKLEAEETFDIDATLGEVRASVDELVREVSDITFARGEKAQRLKDRMARQDKGVLDAKAKALEARKGEVTRDFDERWRVSTDEDGVGFKDMSQQIADDVYDKLTGKNYGEQGMDMADYRVPVSKGPLKERTLEVPDELIEDFLEDNIVQIGERYARTMAGEIELTRKFGRADMRDQLGEIRDDYRLLREEAEARRTPENAKEIRKELKALDDREKLDVKNIEALRDMIRGTYMASANNGIGGRTIRALQTYNYIRSMGGVLISNLTEVYRPAMVHGLRAYLGEGVVPLLTNMAAVKMSVAEAKLVGLVGEMATQHRLMSMAEMGDPYRSGTAIERLLNNGARVGSRWNGIAAITDLTQAMSATLSQNRILAGTAKGAKDDTRFLAYLGIDKPMADRIGQQFKAHGETSQTIRIANTEAWTDAEAVRAYRAAVSKDVNSIIVLKSVGDLPLLANHPLGKAVIQFRTFALASHQRVLLRGLQESKARFASGMAVMSALGMFVTAAAAWRGGGERWEKFKTKAAENPGYLIGEGLDRSGIFALMIEAGNTTEVLTRPTGFAINPVKSPLLAAGKLANPNASAQAQSTRVSNRGPLGSLLGPTASLVDKDVPGALGGLGKVLKGEEASEAQARSAASLVPYGSYVGMKEVLQALQGDSPYLPDQ